MSRGLAEPVGLAPLAGEAAHLVSVALAVGECCCMAAAPYAVVAVGSAGWSGLVLTELAGLVRTALAGVAARQKPVVMADRARR